MVYINLHTHSNFSDGTLTPSDLIKLSNSKGVEYLSLTDHDTVNGYDSLKDDEIKGIKFIKGIEISTKNHDYLHILGYNIDVKNKSFLSDIADYRERRVSRVKEIIRKLNEININISFDDLKANSLTTLGRPHIADALIEKGYGKTRTEVFHKYLIEGCYAYVKPRGPDISEAIKTIKNAGGVAVLAHPSTIEGSFNVEDVIKMGFDGIEVFYPTHTNNKTKKYLEIAKKYNLIVTAGTDYHGPGTDREKLDLFKFETDKFNNIEKIL
ncbi:MAG: PHP domain-containing protein [Elusimicrobiales bacterium]|jgi:predicted metal-dependent phosphoesterase TrpH|nr:PHP domain-containing protein [Elusimicrobiales bacterium]HOL62404.1 PHP domain-containing protein [Elusimicrobiales bacterium]HPO94743.1 PHP domain-containing protein [Elusimicrobiales bacterium]